VFDDPRRPFAARIDLGPEPVPHTITVVAHDRNGRRLDTDALAVNQPVQASGIAFSAVEPREGEGWEVEVDVSLPGGRELDRVEFYRNERLVTTMNRGPFRTVLPGPAMPETDFVSVTAHLDDGATMEAVRFLASDPGILETTVNLVEIYVVVTERGVPITTLKAEDFVLRSGRSEIPIERFAVAEEVPLVLGLAVDSSHSMHPIMPDVRNAAARFLRNVVTTNDRAFLVDFDSRPRLLSDTTSDVEQMVRALEDIRADGQTALYDAMEFGLAHLARSEGRRALVILTDGDDYGSQRGLRSTRQTVAGAGVPIHIINMVQGEDPFGRGHRRLDMEALSRDSGGSIYYVGSMAAVLRAYEQISNEVQSQYMLGYATSAPLTTKEAQSIRVELVSGNPDLHVRFAVGRGRQ